MSWAKANKARIGKKLSEETKRKISNARLGNVPWNKDKKGLYKPSEETKQKISKAAMGRILSEEHRRKLGEASKGNKNLLGFKFSEESKKKISQSLKGKYTGENSLGWKGGITPIYIIIRSSSKYKSWREKVFERDNYTCQMCSARSGKGKAVILNSHHIKSFSDYPERRFWVSNGITLCEDCHKLTDTYLKRTKEIKNEQLELKGVIA